MPFVTRILSRDGSLSQRGYGLQTICREVGCEFQQRLCSLVFCADVSDLDKFEETFQEFGKLTAGVDPASLDRQPAGHTNDDVAGLSLKGGFTTL